MRLSTGVALRRGAERFQFVCPAAWGDEYPAPLAALDDGTLVVGASSGLMLLSADGKVRPHPDPAAAGITTELVRGMHSVFSLRVTQQGSEVLAIDAQTVRVIWQDTKSWYSLAAFDDKLLLLRASGVLVEQLTLGASDGKEIDRQTATMGLPVDYAFARATGGAAYALLLFQTAPQLGTLRMGNFNKIAEGLSSISGPLTVGTMTYVAVDGQMSALVDGGVVPLQESAYVLCLEQADDLPYACKPDGIASVNPRGRGLDAAVFKLSWLTPPDLTLLASGKPHDRCDYQWQDMRFDLIALGMPLPGDGASDAGVIAPIGAEPEPSDAGLPTDASGPEIDLDAEAPHDAGAALDAGEPKPAHHGCSVAPLAHGRRLSGLFALAALSWSFSRRRRSRARS